MRIQAFIGALVAAAIGAGVWAGITIATEHEFAIVAWAVGGGVGLGAAVMKGEGPISGLVCAALALAAIFVGKVITVEHIAGEFVDAGIESELTLSVYEEYKRDSEEFMNLTSKDEYPQFMIDYNYTDAESPDEVTAEELDHFNDYFIPILSNLYMEEQSYEVWKEQHRKRLEEVTTISHGDTTDAAVSSLGLFDILFGLLGIGTAFKVGSGGFGE